jgi:hypothetical protein
LITTLRAQDLLVGGISIVLGLVCLAVAVGNWDWFYQLRLARRIQSAWGRRGARIYYAVLGAALITLGAAIMSGWVLHR